MKYRYEPVNVTLVDKAFTNMNMERYYWGLDLAVNALKVERAGLNERLTTAREEYNAIKDALLDNLNANEDILAQNQYNLERYIHEKSAYVVNLNGLINEYESDAVNVPLEFNNSMVQNIQ